MHKTSSGVTEMVTIDLRTNLAENELVRVIACYASPKTKWSYLKLFLEKYRQHHQTRPDNPLW